MKSILLQLEDLRKFYSSGGTRDYSFRKKQLLALKTSLLEHEEEIYKALYEDLGKSPEESWVTETGFVIAEINHTLKHLHHWMKREKVPTNLLNLPSRSYIYKEPLGVVMIIGPWNYPLHLLFAPMIGAIAAGNCVVLKPSEFAPATAGLVRKMIEKIFPSNYIMVAEGVGAEVIPQMLEGFRFNHIFYTGSTSVGRLIYEMAARKLVPVTLELGGKSPCVVEEDANIKVAAKRIALTKFSNAGQMCVAPDYVLVHRSVRDEFLIELKKCISDFYGNPSLNTDYGKIINASHFSRLQQLLKQGRVIYGGNFNAATHHIEPTLMEDVAPDAAIMGEEIFGPVLPLVYFDHFHEAKAIMDKNPDPLAFYVFTQSSEKEKKWLEEIHFGGGCVNNASWHLTNFNLPFGGRGNSGMGAYHGRFSFEVFSHKKAVMKKPTWFDPGIRYPPFKGKLGLFKRIIR